MYGCQQVLLSPDRELSAILNFLCIQSHRLTNMGIYFARQIYFKANRYISKFELEKEYKPNIHYKALHSQAAQQILRSVYESFKSYKELIKAYRKGKIENIPRLPKYRKKGGLALVSYPKQALRLIDGNIRIPLGSQVKCWFGIDSFRLPLPSNIEFDEIRELRILPRNRCFYVELVYKKEIETPSGEPENVLGIDPGLDNWLTCVSNVGTSFIIDGKHIKSMNRWYNKQISTIKQGQAHLKGFWSKDIAAITEKRNRQMRDGINKAARLVIHHCLENQIGRVIFGWNKGGKHEIRLGKKINSEFVPIPTARLKERIAQLCQQYGIEFIETEESYTSKTSFLDGDYLPKYGEKPKDWKPSGRRTKRGLYRTAMNWYVNADCNGAANIIRKVSRTLGISLDRLGRGVLTRPHRVFLWSANKKTAWSDVDSSSHETSLLESPVIYAGE
ncbi:transposase [Moorena sp. SIO3B2]|uniref:RNA-guided endonuclease InsQ/TnpB family protein n=1 Tax=Moorena sp. SIO3B2 TaxID=2607827 RepID=UPI00257BADBF|nr:transposase [Moorena sp. SIO3B2]